MRRATLLAGIIDIEAAAKGIEIGGGAGKFFPGDFQGIDDTHQLESRMPDRLQFGIKEFDVKFGIVDDHPRLPDEIQKVSVNLGK